MNDNSDLATQAAKNPAAFGLLYDQFYSRVYNYMRCRCNELQTAEDLTALVFERLLERIDSYDAGRGAFEPWLFSIARNLVNDHFRRQSLRLLLPWEWFQNRADPAMLPEESAVLREDEMELLRALHRLKPEQRDLLGLRYASKLSHQQIAALTGLSEGNVAVRIHRAIGQLRTILVSTTGLTTSPAKVKPHGS